VTGYTAASCMQGSCGYFTEFAVILLSQIGSIILRFHCVVLVVCFSQVPREYRLSLSISTDTAHRKGKSSLAITGTTCYLDVKSTASKPACVIRTTGSERACPYNVRVATACPVCTKCCTLTLAAQNMAPRGTGARPCCVVT